MTLLDTDEDANTGTNLDLDIASLPASTYQRYIVFFELSEEEEGAGSILCRINGLDAANYGFCGYDDANPVAGATSWTIGWLWADSCAIGTIEI
ncbi:unnamed protein product, partial [marine sediment metagenome]